jgi:hypothetical protein
LQKKKTTHFSKKKILLMGRTYYIQNSNEIIRLLYSTNGNYFWDISIDQMLSKIYANDGHIMTDNRIIPLEEFLCFHMNGVRHVFPEEFAKFYQYYEGTSLLCFPEYNSKTDSKVYKFEQQKEKFFRQ